MADIQHRDIPEAQLHEPKGASTASEGQVYKSDGSGSGAWEDINLDPSSISVERLIDSASTAAIQSPTGLGEANAIQVEFGPAVLTSSDPVNLGSDGTLNVNESGLYRLAFSGQFGRSGGAGVANMLFRITVDGVQAGRSVAAKLDSADIDYYIENNTWNNLVAGQEIRMEVMRDSSGNDSGDLIQVQPTGSWNAAPSATIRVERWTPLS